MKAFPPSHVRRPAAFSLVEIMIVMVIIAVVLALAIPSIEPMMKGSKLTTAADNFRFRLSEARARAIADNRAVQIRLLKFDDRSMPGEKEYFQAFQAGRFQARKDADGNDTSTFIFEPIGGVVRLPDGIAINSQKTLSSLINDDRIPERSFDLDIGGNDSVKYRAFTFRPDGSTDLPKRAGDIWFFTLTQFRDEDQGNTSPDNFITLMVDAYNGLVKLYQR